jgi:hypothetical protein
MNIVIEPPAEPVIERRADKRPLTYTMADKVAGAVQKTARIDRLASGLIDAVDDFKVVQAQSPNKIGHKNNEGAASRRSTSKRNTMSHNEDLAQSELHVPKVPRQPHTQPIDLGPAVAAIDRLTQAQAPAPDLAPLAAQVAALDVKVEALRTPTMGERWERASAGGKAMIIAKPVGVVAGAVVVVAAGCLVADAVAAKFTGGV